MVADIPAGDLGTWVLGLIAVLTVCYLTANILRAIYPHRQQPAHAEQYLTRGEFESFRRETTASIDKVREEMGQLRDQVTGRLERLDSYMHDAFHRAATAHQTILSKVEYLLGFHTGSAVRPLKEDPRE